MVKHAVLSYKADPTEGSSEKANKIKIQKKNMKVPKLFYSFKIVQVFSYSNDYKF